MVQRDTSTPTPYDRVPEVPPLSVRSDDLLDGHEMPMTHVYEGSGGENLSPQLGWSAGPDGTRGYAVTCLDPDAAREGGWWHWVLVGLPPQVTSLETGVGTVGSERLPTGAFQLRNDFGNPAYDGAAPPRGRGRHRYVFAVSALDTDDLGLDATTRAAAAHDVIVRHTLARGLLTVHWER